MKQFYVEQIFATIFALNNKIQEHSNRLTDEITLRQFMLLLAIEHIPADECSYNRIAEKIGTSKQNVKQIVQSLEKKQYVIVTASTTDKRAVNVTMTKGGINAAVGFVKASKQMIKDTADNFTAEELSNLWDLLKRLYAFDGIEMKGFDQHDS